MSVAREALIASFMVGDLVEYGRQCGIVRALLKLKNKQE